MALIPMEYDGGGYEDKSVTITARTNVFEFTKQGTTNGYIIRYNNDFYYLVNTDGCVPILCELDDSANAHRVTLVIKDGSVSNNRSITVRRYYTA